MDAAHDGTSVMLSQKAVSSVLRVPFVAYYAASNAWVEWRYPQDLPLHHIAHEAAHVAARACDEIYG
ncbi:hypothetical protein ACWPKO_22035 (plasmid) [Coraliomargarita sp. W4R53]